MEVRGQGNVTYHFHFHALAQQVAANAFLTQSSCYTRLLSSNVCTSQAGREGRILSICQSTLQDRTLQVDWMSYLQVMSRWWLK